jgi:flagellar biosynthesis chaperone FliJ
MSNGIEGTLATLNVVRRARLDEARAQLQRTRLDLEQRQAVLEQARQAQDAHAHCVRGAHAQGATLAVDQHARLVRYGHALQSQARAAAGDVQACESLEREAAEQVQRRDRERETLERVGDKLAAERAAEQQRQEFKRLDEHWLLLRGYRDAK